MAEVLECSICDADIPLERDQKTGGPGRMFLLQGHFHVSEGDKINGSFRKNYDE